MEWYNLCLDALNNAEKLYKGKDTSDIIQNKVIQVCSLSLSLFPLNCYKMRIKDMSLLLRLLFSVYAKLLKGKNEDMELFFGKELKSGDFSDFSAECLTDTWIGKDRYQFLPHLPPLLSFIHTCSVDAQLVAYFASGGPLLI